MTKNKNIEKFYAENKGKKVKHIKDNELVGTLVGIRNMKFRPSPCLLLVLCDKTFAGGYLNDKKAFLGNTIYSFYDKKLIINGYYMTYKADELAPYTSKEEIKTLIDRLEL